MPYILIYLTIVFLIVVEFHMSNTTRKLTFAFSAMSILFPVGGMILFGTIFFKKNTINNANEISYFVREPMEFKEPFFLSNINVREESDIVPLEDTLLLSDLNIRRKTVLKILKKGSDKYISFINKAVKNEDSETTHYAATSIMKSKRNLDANLIEISRQYEIEPMNINIISSYLDLLEKQINIVYLDNERKRRIIQEMIRVYEKIINNKLSENQENIIRLIELLIYEENLTDARNYIKILVDDYDDTEEKYMCLLRSYYLLKDKENFEKVLSKIMKENIPLSNEATQRIRFW